MSLKRQILVPVGKMLVSTDPDLTLFTCVGSCIAVALYDTGKKVAGLIHIVLPGYRSALRPGGRNTFYADTGIPLLIKEMLQHGASLGQINAIVVGGASLSPDGSSDIGRSNTEKTLSLLEDAGIPVLKRETGGRDGRVIEVQVATGKAFIRSVLPSGRKQHSIINDDQLLPDSLLSDLADLLEHMQPDPRVASNLFEAIHQDKINWQAAADLIHQDIVLAMHVYQKCNSSYYGIPQKIDSLEAALALLGPEKLRQICVVSAAGKNYTTLMASIGIDQKSLSAHCLASAIIARDLAKETCADLQGAAFTAALFHAAGHIAAKGITASDATGPNPGSQEGCKSFMVNDSAVYQDYLNSALLAKWNFPAMIMETLSDRHLPRQSNKVSLKEIVNISCSLSTMLGISGRDERDDLNLSLCPIEDVAISDVYIQKKIPDIIQKLRRRGLLPEKGANYE